MSEPVVIRNAEERDADAVSALFTVLGHPCPSEQVRKRITVFAEAPGHRFLVAEVDGAVVGFATANTAESPRRQGKNGDISALAIAESHQRKGIGRRLVRTVEDWLRSEGAVRVRLTSASHRTETAHRFYPALGYRRTGLRFDKDLTPP